MSSLRAIHPTRAWRLHSGARLPPPREIATSSDLPGPSGSGMPRATSCGFILGANLTTSSWAQAKKRSTIGYVLVACNPPVRGAHTRIVAYFTRVVRFEKVAWLELRGSLNFTWKSSLFKKTRCVIIRVWLGPKPKEEYD
jgi:hypothetical protein